MAHRSQQSFEEGIKRIEHIVEALESGEISLEESIKLYRDGVEILDYCSNKLNDAEKQVMILQKNSNNQFRQEPFTEKSEE